jgi:hypothetical protein
LALEAGAVKNDRDVTEEDLDTSSEGETGQGPRQEIGRRSAKRLRRFSGRDVGGSSGKPSVLEMNSVTPKTREKYRAAVKEFLRFGESKGERMKTAESIDTVMVQSLTHLFLLGYDLSRGVYTLVGFMTLFPRYGRGGYLGLPRAQRALAPQRSRVGVAFHVVAGLASALIQLGRLDMAAWVILAHGCYLRPVTCMGLRRRCLVAPRPGATRCWSILLSASEYNLVSKTGTSDDPVLWDVHGLEWFAVVLGELAKGNKDEVLWNFNYLELCRAVKKASQKLQVSFVPYQLRHSGPSWDRLRERRTLAEIMKRGLRQSHKSVARYEQAARSGSECLKIPPALREWMERCTTMLEKFILEGVSVPPIPAG